MTTTWCPECEVTFEGESCPGCRYREAVHEAVEGFDIRKERGRVEPVEDGGPLIIGATGVRRPRIGLAPACCCLMDRETGKTLELCTAHRRQRGRH